MAKTNPLYTEEVLFSLVIYNKKVRNLVEYILGRYEQSRRFANVSELEFDVRYLTAVLDYRVGGVLPRMDDIANSLGISNQNASIFKKALIEKIFVTIEDEKVLMPIYE
jgi:hypothetical protein